MEILDCNAYTGYPQMHTSDVNSENSYRLLARVSSMDLNNEIINLFAESLSEIGFSVYKKGAFYVEFLAIIDDEDCTKITGLPALINRLNSKVYRVCQQRILKHSDLYVRLDKTVLKARQDYSFISPELPEKPARKQRKIKAK